jgi:integrase/recombinase XerD
MMNQTNSSMQKRISDYYRWSFNWEFRTRQITFWLREKNRLWNFFPSNRNRRLNHTVVNRLFNTYSAKIGKDITAHDLRHFFCSKCHWKGMSIHEVANQAGRSNIHTTMLYTNPTKKGMLEKMDLFWKELYI